MDNNIFSPHTQGDPETIRKISLIRELVCASINVLDINRDKLDEAFVRLRVATRKVEEMLNDGQ